MNARIFLVRWVSGAVLFSAAVTMGCRADTVYLTDGREINGTIISEDQQTVVVRTTRGVTRSIRRAEIDTVVHDRVKTISKDEPKVVVPAKPASATPAVGAQPSVPPVVDPNVPAKKQNTPTAPAAAENTTRQMTPPTTTPVASTTPERPLPASTGSSPKSSVSTAPREVAAGGAAPIANFPENSKRMSKRKEALFADALETIKSSFQNPEDTSRDAAIADIRALGAEAIPYLWAAVQSEDAGVRITCMKLIGQMNGRNCTKRVIETLYMTMPEASAAVFYDVPFVEEMKNTLATITGQSFINVEARRVGVQDGLKKYIEWYKANFKSLPRQVGEPELDPTEKDFDSKLAELRELKLTKRAWPAPGGLPTDTIAGPNKTSPPKPNDGLAPAADREADRKFGESIPTVKNEEALKRPQDKGVVVDDAKPLKRQQDRDDNSAGRRDQKDIPTEADPNPFLRPQDIRRQQNQ